MMRTCGAIWAIDALADPDEDVLEPVVGGERHPVVAALLRLRRLRDSRAAGLLLVARWTRVFFSSLRCFFFAIRLRRFLMTEPTRSLPDR